MRGLLIGLLFGTGVVLVARGWFRTAPPPPLIAALQRVPGHAPAASPAEGWIHSVLGPLIEQAARLGGGRASLNRRLRLAGDERSAEQFLVQQVMWAGAWAAVALLVLLVSGGAARTAPTIAVVALALIGGVLAGDHRLGRKVAARRERISEQFSVAAQLFALVVASGTPPAQAVGEVGRAVGGPLGDEFVAAANRTASGQGFAASMRELAAGTDLPVVERFVHGLLSAIERGSPLSDVVRAQALDAATDSHRSLMESAGRRDIAMLVPVVFCVLPTVVVVCLLPGAVQLGLVTG